MWTCIHRIPWFLVHQQSNTNSFHSKDQKRQILRSKFYFKNSLFFILLAHILVGFWEPTHHVGPHFFPFRCYSSFHCLQALFPKGNRTWPRAKGKCRKFGQYRGLNFISFQLVCTAKKCSKLYFCTDQQPTLAVNELLLMEKKTKILATKSCWEIKFCEHASVL